MIVPESGFPHRRSTATVDLVRLRENFRRVRALGPANAPICPMVKADAYGHGDVHVSRVLRAEGAEHLGVVATEEGIRLRKAGDKGSILVFGGFHTVESIEELIHENLTPVVCDWSQLQLLNERAGRIGRSEVAIHLEFDTGMGRLGFTVEEAVRLREWLNNHPRVKLRGVATHFVRGEDLGVPGGDSERQLQLFSRALAAFQGLRIEVHTLSSSSIVAGRRRSLENFGLKPADFGSPGMRPGISIYGEEPSANPDLQMGVKPVLRWASRLARVHRVEKGGTISYNGTWRAPRESWIGVVPVGYADGFRRALSNRGFILCRGRRAPVVGNVCMDYFMTDLTDVVRETGSLEAGEEVVIIGEQNGTSITANEVASWIQTISYEVLTGIGARVPRVYIESESESGGA